MGWLSDFEEVKKKAEESDHFVNKFLDACRDKDKVDEWKKEYADKEKEKDTFRFWF